MYDDYQYGFRGIHSAVDYNHTMRYIYIVEARVWFDILEEISTGVTRIMVLQKNIAVVHHYCEEF